MTWTHPNERTSRSGDYVVVLRDDGRFYLMSHHRNLGRFRSLVDGQQAAEAHAALVAGVDEMYFRLVGFLKGEAPQ